LRKAWEEGLEARGKRTAWERGGRGRPGREGEEKGLGERGKRKAWKLGERGRPGREEEEDGLGERGKRNEAKNCYTSSLQFVPSPL
jgi:hypothetical protein